MKRLIGATLAVVSCLGAMAQNASFSHDAYNGVLGRYVSAGGLVDYRGLKADRAQLDAFRDALAKADQAVYGAWSDAQKIAFWINAYNALTLVAIIDHYPIQSRGLLSGLRFPSNSIRQIDGVWKEIEWTIMGKQFTLDAIEHQILRKEFDEPRIHMAIVCAALSCPYLRTEAYVADRLDEQLADQSRKFLADPRKGMREDRANTDLYLSSIFKWFGGDFKMGFGTTEIPGHEGIEAAVLNFVSQNVDKDSAAWIRSGDYSVYYLDYDWTLNEQN